MASSSVVKVSGLERTQRLDPEFYHPQNLNMEEFIRSLPTKPLTDLCHVSDGNHALISQWFTEEGVRYLRGQDITDYFIGDAAPVFIPMDLYLSSGMRRSHFKPLDVLLSIVGTVGSVALVPEHIGPLTGNCKIAILRSHSIDPFYLSAFLLSKYGQTQIHRHVRGALQTGLILDDFDQIVVPDAPQTLQEEIRDTILKAQSRRRHAVDLYRQAEQIVLTESGCDTLELSQHRWWTAPLTSVQKVRRLDAEHFEPKYDELIAHLRNTGKATQIKDILAEPIQKGVTPDYDSDGSIVVVNSQHLGQYCLNFESCERTTETFWQANSRARIQRNDVMIYATGAYIGRTNAYLESARGLAGVDILLVRPTDACKPLYLAVFLNAMPGLMQSKRFSRGSGQAHIYPDDVSHYWVYISPETAQQKVTDLVEESHQARQNARDLLEEAKTKVEAFVSQLGRN